MGIEPIAKIYDSDNHFNLKKKNVEEKVHKTIVCISPIYIKDQNTYFPKIHNDI